MNMKFLAALLAVPLAACVAPTSNESEEVSRSAQAFWKEHVQDSQFNLPGDSLTKVELPLYDDAADLDGSHPFPILAGMSWYGQFNDLYANGLPANKQSLHLDFTPGQVAIRAGQGVRGGVVQQFAAPGVYTDNDDCGEYGPRLSVRIQRTAGAAIVQLLKRDHPETNTPGLTCSFQVDESNAPAGQWVELSKNCNVPDGYKSDPNPDEPYDRVTVQAHAGGDVVVDKLSVTTDVWLVPPTDTF